MTTVTYRVSKRTSHEMTAFRDRMSCMSAVKGRAHRARSTSSKKIMLQGRVDEPLWAKANRAADAAGIALAAYLQRLVDRDEVDANGCPLWLDPRDRGQEELPLRTA